MIAIMAAMKEELDAIVAHVEKPIVKLTPFGELVEGYIDKKSVVCAQSGIGKAVAAATTTFLIERYPISKIINIGTAGGLSMDLSVTDVVVADRVSYHDFDISAFGYPKGWDNSKYVFKCDEDLISLAQNQAHEISSNLWVGSIVSGDQFITDKAQFNKITTMFEGVLAVDMEGAAIAHVAYLYDKPVAIIRSISDIVFDDSNHVSFVDYIKKAAIQSATCVVNVIKQISSQ